MTKAELEEKYFHEFLIWCAVAPEGKPGEIIFWIDYHYPTGDNFWEWLITCKKEIFNAEV